jgi:DNA modification methylase
MTADQEPPYRRRRTADAASGRFAAEEIPLELLEPAPWNPNRVSAEVASKLERSIDTFGIVENLVVRPHPIKPGSYEVISGNFRLDLYRSLGFKTAPCHIVSLDDAHARLLAQTLNRARGEDDPEAYARLLEQVLSAISIEEVLGYLPESEHSIDRLLSEYCCDEQEAAAAPSIEPAAEPQSKLGEIYELGRHRLLCGNATDREQVQALMQGAKAALIATDPPYGIMVDHSWRDGVRQPRGSARTGRVANDDRCDWRDAYLLTDAPVAYIWHSALHAREAWDSLEAAGFEIRQQIVWVKDVHALGRAAYQWKHECCWYAVRRSETANWRGGRDQMTVWHAPSPIMAYGAGGDDASTPHPTQKPLLLFETPIRNHTASGEVVYEPFAGSGTQLIAAEKLGRRCFAIELDPVYCDLIRQRYEDFRRGGARSG